MSDSHLRTILSLEHSLAQLRTSLLKMDSLHTTQQHQIARLAHSTLSLVDQKLQQAQIGQHASLQAAKRAHESQEAKRRNRESRLVGEKQVGRSRELVSLMKHHNSLHLREGSRHNEQTIRELRIRHLKQKQERSEAVRQRQQQSMQRVQQFHLQKQQQLRKDREEEDKIKQRKAKQLIRQLRDLTEQQIIKERQTQQMQENAGQFKEALKKLGKADADSLKQLRALLPSDPVKEPQKMREVLLQLNR